MKVSINDLNNIKEHKLPEVEMRIAKNGNTIIIPYDEEAKNSGAKEILQYLIEENNKLLSNVAIIKGEAPQGEFSKSLLIVSDNLNLYVYQNINKEIAKEIFEQHAIKNLVVSKYNPTKLEIIK